MESSGKKRARWRKPLALGAVIAAGLVLLGAVAVLAGAVPGLPTVHATCSVSVHSENGADNAIQSAINAYPGGVICIGAGTFPEQLTIQSSGTTLIGAGAAKTIIEPNEPLTLNTKDYDSAGASTPAAAVILVEGSSGDPTTGVTGVTIESLQVNGVAGQSTFTSCSDDYYGVDFQASSGTLTSATVTGIELPPADFGCQPGVGVYAYNGWFNYAGVNFEPVAVTISHSTIAAYDKNGVTCDDPDETCTIASNTVTGIGPTTAIAQNGIQIGFGAVGSVTSNHVSGNSYTGSTSTNDWYANGYSAAGILLYDSGTGTSISSNTVSLNQIGIASYADGVSGNGYSGPASTAISHNTVSGSNGYGIVANGAPGGGDSFTIASNTVNNQVAYSPSVWGAPGILVDTGTFFVSQNKIEGSSTAAGSSNGASQIVCGPTTSGTGNPFTYCTTATSITTAAIQGASESGTSQTNVTLNDNTFVADTWLFASQGVLGGTVNVLEE